MSAIENLINHCAGLLDIDITETQEAAAELSALRAELDKKDVRIEELDMALKMMHFGKDDR